MNFVRSSLFKRDIRKAGKPCLARHPGEAPGGDEVVQTQLFERAEHGSDGPVGAGTHDVKGVLAPKQRFVLEQSAQGIDFALGPLDTSATTTDAWEL